MIRLKTYRRFRIPNRMALMGAVLLALTTFTGFSENSPQPDELAARPAEAAAHPAADGPAEPASGDRRITISRLLFGHG